MSTVCNIYIYIFAFQAISERVSEEEFMENVSAFQASPQWTRHPKLHAYIMKEWLCGDRPEVWLINCGCLFWLLDLACQYFSMKWLSFLLLQFNQVAFMQQINCMNKKGLLQYSTRRQYYSYYINIALRCLVSKRAVHITSNFPGG